MNSRKYLMSQCAGLLGNIIEHKDKALFGLLTPFIADQFFPSEDYLVSLIEMYGILVLSLLVKPFGSFAFGRMADSEGRKKALLISMYGMSFATLGIGLVPSYHAIGYFAPALVFLLRCAQNFFSAAEPTNGAVYVLENCNKKWQAFAASLFEASSMLGIVIASLETTVLAYFEWMESGWQWLFIFAGGMGFLCTIWRDKAIESLKISIPPLSLKELWEQRHILLSIAVMTAFSYATYLFSITFINGYLKATSSLNTLQLTSLNTLLTFFDLLTLPLFGYLAIYVAPRHLMGIATTLLGFLALPLFIWMRNFESALVILSVRVVIVLCGVCFAAPYRALLQEKVTRHRCTILNLGGALGQMFAQGPLTIICLAALYRDLWYLPALILAILSFLTSFTVWQLSKKEELSFREVN